MNYGRRKSSRSFSGALRDFTLLSGKIHTKIILNSLQIQRCYLWSTRTVSQTIRLFSGSRLSCSCDLFSLCVLTLDKPEWKEWEKDLTAEGRAFFHACVYQRAEIERKRHAATKSHSTVVHGDCHIANVVIAEAQDGTQISGPPPPPPECCPLVCSESHIQIFVVFQAPRIQDLWIGS
jgi:hypothetical protein